MKITANQLSFLIKEEVKNLTEYNNKKKLAILRESIRSILLELVDDESLKTDKKDATENQREIIGKIANNLKKKITEIVKEMGADKFVKFSSVADGIIIGYEVQAAIEWIASWKKVNRTPNFGSGEQAELLEAIWEFAKDHADPESFKKEFDSEVMVHLFDSLWDKTRNMLKEIGFNKDSSSRGNEETYVADLGDKLRKGGSEYQKVVLSIQRQKGRQQAIAIFFTDNERARWRAQ